MIKDFFVKVSILLSKESSIRLVFGVALGTLKAILMYVFVSILLSKESSIR